MILVITGLLLGGFLVGKFWRHVFEFLNGTIRDLLEKLIGERRCQWYVRLLEWLDDKVCATTRTVKNWWRRFKQNVLRIRSTYVIKGDTGKKNTEVIIATSDTKARRIVTEETISRHDIPSAARHEMIRQRKHSAVVDEKEVAHQKLNQKLEAMVYET